MRVCAYGGERQPGCLRASTQPAFLYKVLFCGRGLRACRVLRTRPFCLGSVYPLNCCWPHNCLLCAYTQTHLHTAAQTADADPFAIVIQVNFRTDMNGAHETDGRSARGQLCSCGQCAVQLRAFSTVAVLTQLRHRRPKVCRSIHLWDPRVLHVCIMEHVPLRQSIKCNLCPVTPEELKQPQGVVSTWPREFQISPLLAPQDFLSWLIFKSLSTRWHISRTLCSLDHRKEVNLPYLIFKKCSRLQGKNFNRSASSLCGWTSTSAFSGWLFSFKASDGFRWLVYCTQEINLSVWSLCSHTARCDLLSRVMYDADMARGDVHISGTMIYLFSKQGSNVLGVLISNKMKQPSLILQQVDLNSQSNGGKKDFDPYLFTS